MIRDGSGASSGVDQWEASARAYDARRNEELRQEWISHHRAMLRAIRKTHHHLARKRVEAIRQLMQETNNEGEAA